MIIFVHAFERLSTMLIGLLLSKITLSLEPCGAWTFLVVGLRWLGTFWVA